MPGLGATKTSRDEHQQDDAPSRLFRSGSAGSYGTILALQRAVGNEAVGQLLRPDHDHSDIVAAEPESSHNWAKTSTATLQASSRNGKANNAAEQQADRAAETVVQSKGRQSQSRSLIVADDAPRLDAGQMRKNDFLNLLETSVTRAAEEELKGTIWSAMGCPYIERWFSHYRSRDSRHVEAALRKYAPEAAGAGTAREYVPILTERVRRGIAQWTQTGDTTGVPEEFTQGGMPGATLQGLVGGVLSGIGGALAGAASAVVSGIGSAISGIGKVLFKEREGGANAGADPEAIRGQMDSGQPLDATTQARMGESFGADFSRVRVHTEPRAAQLSERLNAQAFTIGEDVAFGAGEYRPGTLIGDALIAHELAHVVQQSSADPVSAPLHKGGSEYDGLEADADESAVSAVVSMWSGTAGRIPHTGRTATPRLRSGLKLQGCNAKKSYPQLDLSKVPEGRLREAAAELSQSDEILDRNTARQLADGNVIAHYYEDLAQPSDVDTKLRGWGLDTSVYTVYLHPVTGDEMVVQKNSEGSLNVSSGSHLFMKRSMSLSRAKEILVHETNHAINPHVTATTDALERYKTEFRAYWVAEFRSVTDLDERARLVREHILSLYPIIKTEYDAKPAVKTAIDSYTRPEGDLTNLGTLTPEGTTTK
jgi:hypothetical protein